MVSDWHHGAFLGQTAPSGEYVVGTPGGICRPRTIHRRPEDKRWDFGWRAIRHVLEHAHPGARGSVPLTLQLLPLCREAAQLASLFVGLTALSCDPNVLRLIAGEYTPHQCMMGMAADLKVRTNPSPRLHIRAQRRPNTNF